MCGKAEGVQTLMMMMMMRLDASSLDNNKYLSSLCLDSNIIVYNNFTEIERKQ